MKKFRLIIIAATVLAVTFSASAQTKIAVVNMKKLFDGYYKTKQALAALDKQGQDLQKEVKDMTDALNKARSDYKQLLNQANDQAISTDARDKDQQAAADKAREINNQQADLQQFQSRAETQFSDAQKRMISNLLAEIQKYVATKAKADGYTLVINSANTDALVYSSPDTDITAAVLALENAGAPVDVTQPSAPLLNVSTNAP